MKKLLDNKLIDLTANEITARQAEEEQAVIDKQTREAAEQATIDKKTSGKQKLKDLGLTDAEIKALIGT